MRSIIVKSARKSIIYKSGINFLETLDHTSAQWESLLVVGSHKKSIIILKSIKSAMIYLNLPQLIILFLSFIFQTGQCWLPKFPLCSVLTSGRNEVTFGKFWFRIGWFYWLFKSIANTSTWKRMNETTFTTKINLE